MSENDTYYLEFTSGKLVRAKTPDWFDQAIAQDGDWDAILRGHEVSRVEQFGEHGNTIRIYRAPNGHYVELHDVFELVARIFINDVIDYLHFRRDWILPLAKLDRFSDEDADRQDSSD